MVFLLRSSSYEEQGHTTCPTKFQRSRKLQQERRNFSFFCISALLRVANATSYEGHTTLYNLFFVFMPISSKRMVCHTKLQQERSMVPRAGFEPAQAISPKDFKSFASTISPPRHIYFLLEAAPGFEPGIRVLQTHALPLGYAATSELLPARSRFNFRANSSIVITGITLWSDSSNLIIVFVRYNCWPGPSVGIPRCFHSAMPP